MTEKYAFNLARRVAENQPGIVVTVYQMSDGWRVTDNYHEKTRDIEPGMEYYEITFKKMKEHGPVN